MTENNMPKTVGTTALADNVSNLEEEKKKKENQLDKEYKKAVKLIDNYIKKGLKSPEILSLIYAEYPNMKEQEAEITKQIQTALEEKTLKQNMKFSVYVEYNSYYKVKTKEVKRLTNFTINIIDSTVQNNPDGTIEKLFTLKLITNEGERTINVKNEDIIDSKNFTKCIRTNYDNALVDIREDDFASLRAYIFDKSKYSKKIGIDYEGIACIKNQLIFIDNSGAIDNDGKSINSFVSTQTKNKFTLDIKKLSNLEKNELSVLENIFKVNDPRAIALMFGHAIYTTYSGISKILFERGHMDYKNICMFIEGLPSSGKTTISSLIYSICLINDFEQFSSKATDTRLAWDNSIKAYNTMPLVINELNPRDLNILKFKELIDYIKNAYDWLGKSKGNVSTNYQTVIQTTINAPIVTVGQQRLLEDGLNYRGARVYFDKSFKNDETHKILKDLEKNKKLLFKLGRSLKLFNLKTNLDEFCNEYETLINNIREEYKYDERHCRTIATMLQAYKQLERFLATYNLSLKDCLKYDFDEIKNLIIEGFIEFTLDGCEIEKPVEIKYLELINKAAILSKEKTDNDINHIAFVKGADYKLTKKDSILCLAIAVKSLEKANPLIKEYLTRNGTNDNELISLDSFKKAITKTKYCKDASVNVKIGSIPVKSMTFIYDELVKDKIDVDFMIDRDAPSPNAIAEDVKRKRDLTEQVAYWKKENQRLHDIIRELEKKVEDLESKDINF